MSYSISDRTSGLNHFGNGDNSAKVNVSELNPFAANPNALTGAATAPSDAGPALNTTYGAGQTAFDATPEETAAANAGCKIICEDLFYLDAPWFQSGVITQAIQSFEPSGGIFVASAGNQTSAA